MSTALQSFQEKAQQLSPTQLAKVLSFMEELLAEEEPRPKRKLKFNWAGQPGDEPVTESSVELQHQATELRLESAFDYLKQSPVEESCRIENGAPPRQRHKPRFDWIDDEDAEPEPLTSVELQHLATQLWVEKLEKNLERR